MKYILILLCMLWGVMKAENSYTPLPLDMHESRAVKVIYTNWRGETAERTIIPISIFWGKTEWHSHEQWLLKVWDVERGAYRDYALKDIQAWRSN